MNTSATKKRKRYSPTPMDFKKPPGSYTFGILNDRFAAQLCRVIVDYQFVEEDMIVVLRHLLGNHRLTPVRQVFRAVVNARDRLQMMRQCLEDSMLNEKKPEIFDEILDEFESVTRKRNQYVHGQWFTHDCTGDIWFASPSSDDYHFNAARKIGINELNHTLSKIKILREKVIDLDRSKP